MNYPFTLATLMASILYAVIKNYLPDFPVEEGVFQGLIVYLAIKIFDRGEASMLAYSVKSLLPSQKKAVKSKRK